MNKNSNTPQQTQKDSQGGWKLRAGANVSWNCEADKIQTSEERNISSGGNNRAFVKNQRTLLSDSAYLA